jgi:hypothetical protein
MLQYGIFNQIKVVDNNTLKKLDKFSSFVKVISNFNLMKKISEDKLLLSDLNSLNVDSISRLDTEPDKGERKERLSAHGRRNKRFISTEIMNTNDIKEMKKYLEMMKKGKGKSSSTIGLYKNGLKRSFVSRPSTTTLTTKQRIQSTTAIESPNTGSTPFITALPASGEKNILILLSQLVTGETPVLTQQSIKPLTPNIFVKRTNTSKNLFSFPDQQASTEQSTTGYKKTVQGFKKKFAEALINNMNKSTEENDKRESDAQARLMLKKEKVERLKQELETLKPFEPEKFSTFNQDLFSRNKKQKIKLGHRTMMTSFKYKWVPSKYMTLQDYKTRHKDDTLNLLTENCDQIIVTSRRNNSIKYNVPSRNKHNLDFIDKELRQTTVDGMKDRNFIYGDKYGGASMEHHHRLNNTVYKLKPNIF